MSKKSLITLLFASLVGCASASQPGVLRAEDALAAYESYELDLKSGKPVGRYFATNVLEENIDAVLGPDPSTASLSVVPIRKTLRFGDHINKTVKKTATCDNVNCFVVVKFYTSRKEFSQYRLTYINEPSSSAYSGLKISGTELTIY